MDQTDQPPAREAPPPAWTLLEGELHLQTLNPDYAPLGLLEMIPPGIRSVLDVGCFCGGTGRILKGRAEGIAITGIEMLEKAAAMAASSYDRVVVGSLESIDLAPLGQFDAIVAADVLEHLVNPWKALQRLRRLLGPGGRLYASIPNVRNLRVLEQLANGQWPHEGAGIHDVSHLRFFTRAELNRLFAETGWVIEEIRINPDPAIYHLFKGQDLDKLTVIETPNMVLRNLTREDLLELMALQFLVRAVPV